MADLQKPAPGKRALPFKRTARPKPPTDEPASADDDGLALFSQSKNYFPTVVEDQQRRAREKAEKAEQDRKEKLAREQEEQDRKDRKTRLRHEQRRRVTGDEAEAEERDSATKRRRLSCLSENEGTKRNSEEDDDIFVDQHPKPYRPATPPSTSTGGGTSAPGSSRTPTSAYATRTSKRQKTPVILLDSSDDEDISNGRSKRPSCTAPPNGRPKVTDKLEPEADDSNSDLEMWEEDKQANKEGTEGEREEDPSEFYIKAAMERMRKAKEARLAREASTAVDGDKNKAGTPGIDDDRGAPVSVMIVAPALPDTKPLCCTVRTTQALQIAFDTFRERQKKQTAYPHKVISELVFTWRGDRVYHTTKLETLGICPKGPDGRLYDSAHGGRSAPEGYMGRDKVYFEAWTPEDYEANQQKRQRERKQQELGEWWGEDSESNNGDDQAETAEAPQEEDDRVRVIFKARGLPPRNVTLRKYSTVAHMIKAFRKLAGLAPDKHVEIRWDGEVLDLETTVEEADIADMDSVEVHVR